uniref:Myosin VI n=1 Tax=Macaca fascicularis TaxID=9541 RepID=A0A7N9DEV1_MACFA
SNMTIKWHVLLYKLPKQLLVPRNMILVNGNMQNYVIPSIPLVILSSWQLAEKNFIGD